MLAAGKAAGAMAEVAEQHYLDAARPAAGIAGMAVTRHGYGRPTRRIPVIEAGHPVPDAASLAGAERALTLAEAPAPTIWCWCCCRAAPRPTGSRPAAGVTLAEKQAVNRALLKAAPPSATSIPCASTSPASRAAGWRARAHPAQVVTLAISDVPATIPR